ncbi:hypothetical protein BK749_16570 [Bacillus thuringiensis serovar vazensis]|uniref:Uncharacterized protein n=1 Tax=Bacillus thuringiensis serovar vazensis TaxID=180867 RepID=A0A243CUS0_BACTU|nr:MULTISPECIES: hypothetical protein [Bacillus cereus group]EEM89517.1 hypothetical protein bthur0012_24500 [Bacillus thuringiensis serovar pulsiensis BGSC 4CC1]MDX5914132.1 hypothetical protein [Bacillus cereus group sp. BfR-BA-01026]OTY73906.1 hypothetical protein BK749_16570 [Bacillus thuringiensis serovar vazensis]
MSEQKSALSVKVEVDTKEANQNIKELTAAVNECAEAFEKLEQVTDRFTNKSYSIEIEVPILLNGKQIAEAITNVKKSELIQKINDSKSVGMDSKVWLSLDGKVTLESIVEHTADSIQGRVIKGSEINETK